MGTKNNPGEFDCYEAAEPDEPMFVLLARDPVAAALVRQWAMNRHEREGFTPKVQEAYNCSDAMQEWRAEHSHP